jgi:hypothetical protein
VTERPAGKPEPHRNARVGRALALAGACLAVVLGSASARAARPALTLVVCAPGYPGSAAEAQPAMDALAAAAAAAAGWPPGELTAVYHETEQAGLEHLAEPQAGLALVPLPFWLKHGAALGLLPQLQAIQQGGEAAEAWSLVVPAGAGTRPSDLAGYEVLSLAGYAPRFVRGPALAAWGELPAGVTITFSPAVLSSLRKAGSGAKVAVLLDQPEAAALPTLPYAARLKVVARSRPLPVSVLCAVGQRLPAPRLAAAVKALMSLASRPGGAAALAGVRLTRFIGADQQALAAARADFERIRE